MRVLAWIVAAILIAPLAAALEDPNRALRPSLVAARSAIPSIVGGPHLMSPDPHVGSWPSGAVQGSPLVGPRASPVGTADILVLLIEFTDVVHEPTHDQTFFDRFFNDTSPGAQSMRAFYAEASYGALTINATIVPMWFVSSYTMAYYGQDGLPGVDAANGPIYNLVTESVRAADPFVNFSAFDTDRNGVVDHLMVVHAGAGQESHANQTDLIWSHSWVVGGPSLIVDGVRVSGYTMVSEDSPLGVSVHEFGHDLGLPDLYDTDYSSDGAGIWDVMSEGAWNGAPRGSNPAMFSAWSKIHLGWLTPTYGPFDFAADTPIPAIETHAFAYRLDTVVSPSEYFLIENREPIDFDAALPAHGLLIWHVDDSRPNNADDAHRLLDLEEMDEGVNGDRPTDAGDPWHDTAVGFGPDTNPSSFAYGPIPTKWRVRDISAIGDPMTATILYSVRTDVAVQEIRAPSMVPLGGSVTARVVVRNDGGTPADARLFIRVYRDNMSPANLVFLENRTIALAFADTALVNVSFSATALGRYLIDAAVSSSGDAIPSDDERIIHVSTNAFAFRDDMEAANGNWTVSGAPDDNPRWSLLNASAANGSAHGGSFAWRFGYASNTTLTPAKPPWRALTSAVVNVTESAYLIFYHRFDLSNATDSRSPGDSRATVEVRYGGGPWAVLATYSERSLQWGGASIPLSPPVLPTTMQIRFNATAGDMPGRGGWWIDDVAIATRGLTHAVVLLPPSIAADAAAGTFASASLKVANVGDFEDSVLVNASVLVGWGALFAPPGGLPTLASRTVVVGPDRDAVVDLAILVPPGTAPGSYVATVYSAGPMDANASATITIAVRGESTVGFVTVAAIAGILGVAVALVGFLLWRRPTRRPPT